MYMLKAKNLSSKSPLPHYSRNDALFWLRLSRVPGVGNVIFNRLIKKFSTPEKVFHASPEELKKVEGIRSLTVNAIPNCKDTSWVEKELDQIEKHEINFLTILDTRYPQNLKTIYDPPPFSIYQGRTSGR